MLGYEKAFLSSTRALALLKFYFCVMQYSCSGSVLCCSAGGWEEEEDADEIWIISSQCLAKPHFAGTAAFQCSSPPTQPASCRPSIWLLTPRPAFNQPNTYTLMSLSPQKKQPPPPGSAASVRSFLYNRKRCPLKTQKSSKQDSK